MRSNCGVHDDLPKDTHRERLRDDNKMKIELDITVVLRVRIQDVSSKSP
jgi:hypothetical protein